MWCGGVEKPGEADMRMLVKDGEELKRYESNGAIGEGQGTKAGVTYRLGDGRWANDLRARGEGGALEVQSRCRLLLVAARPLCS